MAEKCARCLSDSHCGLCYCCARVTLVPVPPPPARELQVLRETVSVLTNREMAKLLPCELTDREIQIVREVVLGHSNREIAAKLGIAEDVVQHQLYVDIMGKLGVSNRVALIHKLI